MVAVGRHASRLREGFRDLFLIHDAVMLSDDVGLPRGYWRSTFESISSRSDSMN